MPIDLILGDQQLRLSLEGMVPMADLEASWAKKLKAFDTMRRDYFLYE